MNAPNSCWTSSILDGSIASSCARHGSPGTGTASDAVTVVCPPDGPAEAFAGPRSIWGARLARAVRDAVLAGAVARDANGYPR